jgi:cell division protein ZapA
VSEKNKVALKICGNEFIISSEDKEEYVRAIGTKVEDHINRLANYSSTMSTSMAAMFTALEFCDEATKAKDAADNLRNQIKEYLEDAVRAKGEASELRKREQNLKKELQELRAKLGSGNSAR